MLQQLKNLLMHYDNKLRLLENNLYKKLQNIDKKNIMLGIVILGMVGIEMKNMTKPLPIWN
jgi:hypothetical protein